MKQILYLTYNDAPSGIYAGQVIDVCRYWNELPGYHVTLVAIISIRGYSENKAKILRDFPEAIVLPMVPRAKNWRLNRFLLRRVIRKISPDLIAGRGPFATALAMYFREGRKICFDGRGAYIAELNEYNVVPDENVKREIAALEKQVVLESDFRLAVSDALVRYWQKEFGYQSNHHVVVPCTLNSRSVTKEISENAIADSRKALGFSESETVIVYSGSGAGWQSLNALGGALLPLFRNETKLKLLLLLKELPSDFQLATEFPDRVIVRWLSPAEVIPVMTACDYGWLVRENTVTNQVASPVKFAEYLAAGLRVIISPGLGDYPEFVEKHDAGIIFSEKLPSLPPVTFTEKKRLQKLASDYFTKEKYRDNYLRLLQ